MVPCASTLIMGPCMGLWVYFVYMLMVLKVLSVGLWVLWDWGGGGQKGSDRHVGMGGRRFSTLQHRRQTSHCFPNCSQVRRKGQLNEEISPVEMCEENLLGRFSQLAFTSTEVSS